MKNQKTTLQRCKSSNWRFEGSRYLTLRLISGRFSKGRSRRWVRWSGFIKMWLTDCTHECWRCESSMRRGWSSEMRGRRGWIGFERSCECRRIWLKMMITCSRCFRNDDRIIWRIRSFAKSWNFCPSRQRSEILMSRLSVKRFWVKSKVLTLAKIQLPNVNLTWRKKLQNSFEKEITPLATTARINFKLKAPFEVWRPI